MSRTSRLVLVMIFVTFVSGQQCTNCQNGCDQETGECSGGCNSGWDGPTCSRQNVALNRSTTQSSTWSVYTSRLAVDGGTDLEWFRTPPTCTHTQENRQPASWTVTLDTRYNIYSFRIYNRKGGCKSGPLCTPGTYGPDKPECGKRCGNCAGGPSVCDATSGLCPQRTPRCMAGYRSEKCDEECGDNTWGADCSQRCGQCYNRTRCDVRTGECPVEAGNPRCDPGYSGNDCVSQCDDNTWGDECAQRCGQYYNNVQYDVRTGECHAEAGNPRCAPEYSGNDCVSLIWRRCLLGAGRISTAFLSGGASQRRLAGDTQQAPSPSQIILTPGRSVAAITQ